MFTYGWKSIVKWEKNTNPNTCWSFPFLKMYLLGIYKTEMNFTKK